MDQQPLIGAQRPQPIGRPDIVGAFGDVDVHTDAVTHSEVGRSRQRLVGARERGVHADHSAATLAEEPIVLGESPASAGDAVTIGDPVTGVDPHAHLGAGIGDDAQRPLDGVR